MLMNLLEKRLWYFPKNFMEFFRTAVMQNTCEKIPVNVHATGSFTKFCERDTDTNFFDDIIKSNFEASYFKPNEVKPYLWSTQYLEKFNVLHVIIRSITRKFENSKALLEECELVFNIICISETWCENNKLQINSNLFLTWFESVLYERSKKSSELIFTEKILPYKIRKDLYESDKHKQILFLEILFKNSFWYKPSKSENDVLSMFLIQIFKSLLRKINPSIFLETST